MPPRLAQFDPDEWSGTTLEERFALWRDARFQWVKEGGRWPGGSVAMLRQCWAVRYRIHGMPLPPTLGPNGERLPVNRFEERTEK